MVNKVCLFIVTIPFTGFLTLPLACRSSVPFQAIAGSAMIAAVAAKIVPSLIPVFIISILSLVLLAASSPVSPDTDNYYIPLRI
jgi:hypothetical protein